MATTPSPDGYTVLEAGAIEEPESGFALHVLVGLSERPKRPNSG